MSKSDDEFRKKVADLAARVDAKMAELEEYLERLVAQLSEEEPGAGEEGKGCHA